MADDQQPNSDIPKQANDQEGGQGVPAASDRGEGAQPSLQEIIAKQKAKLQEKLKERAAAEADPAEAAPAEPGETGDTTPSAAPPDDEVAPPAAPAEADEAPDAHEAASGGTPEEAEADQDRREEPAAPPAGECEPGDESPQGKPAQADGPREKHVPAAAGARSVSLLQIALLMNTALIGLVVGSLCGLLPFRMGQPTGQIILPAPIPPKPAEPAKTPGDPTAPTTPAKSTSLQAAEADLANRRYDQALEKYRLLLAVARVNGDDILVADFFRLRIAQSLRHLGQAREARSVYETVSGSGSPIVAALANHHLASMDESRGQYLLARMRAYRAIAALNALRNSSPLETDCDFLIARVLTRKVKRFYQAEDFIPWPAPAETDPFAGLDQQELSDLLHEGAARRKVSALDVQVQIERVGGDQAVAYWSVRCTRVPLEEVIHQFAAAESADVQWTQVGPPVRLRTVSLQLRSIPSRRLNEVVCGMAGLIARFTLDKLQIHDPHAQTIMSKQRDLLVCEAESVWRRFFLRAAGDPRVAVGRFALAGLQELSGEAADALREYQLVSRRFKRDDVAPRALVRCARIRFEKLRDYRGARQDLLDLLNIWPEYGKSAEVNLILGRTCLQAGLLDEALKVFCRLYHLNLTAGSQRQACLGAGECFHRKGDFKEAARWLVRYINLASQSSKEDLARAYLVLGRSYAAQGDTAEAAAAFQQALAWFPTERQHVAAALGLGRARLDRQEFLSAVGVLETLKKKYLRPNEMQEFLLLMARAYREMGLAGRAQLILADGSKLAAITDPEIRAEIVVELARCCAESGDLADARKWLLEAAAWMKPGQQAWQAKLDLADVCLRLGNAEQAIAVARELSQARCPAWVRQRATEILVAAYVMQRDFQGAAGALSSVAIKPEGAGR